MDEKMRQEIALHRWAVIAEAANGRLSGGERGAVVRAIAAREHAHPDGTARRYSRGTIDRWLRAWRAGGIDGLRPSPRSDTGKVRAMPELFAEAAALRLELPGRSAAQISSILYHRHGVRVAERTIRGQLRRAGLHRAALKAAPKAWGRYEAERPNERWVTDVLVGPWVPYPFGKAIAARDLFARQAHAEAIARISFCVVEQTLGVVTGDVGAGKTVAVRAAVAALDPTRHQVIYIPNPAFGSRGLYVSVVRALGAQPRYLKAELMAQAAGLLAAEDGERHRTVVVIIDEAHLLDPAQLEEFRLMSNSEMDSASPFAGILIGQPTLNRQLRMGAFAAIDQRIATRFTIKPMDLAESAAYLRHHMKLAGREAPVFADDAVARLHRVAGGLPRALNNAATAALMAAAAAGQDLVDDACAKKAVAELTRD
jgi:type II secretory pathway predicted ATPase ExeA/transposase